MAIPSSTDRLSLDGDTPASQMLATKGMNTVDNVLAQFSPTGDLGKINSVDQFTGLINRLVEMALVETWEYEVPYLKYMRQLPVDMVNKVVQIIGTRPNRGREFDAIDTARILERHYPKSESRVYGINFDRQYPTSVNDYLLQRGGSASAVLTLVGQQLRNNINSKNQELTDFINDVVSNWVILNYQNLVNIHFAPADPTNPTPDELVQLSQRIDQVSMDMTRFTGNQFALSDIGYVTNVDDLVIDTTSLWPAALRNRVLPWAFHKEVFNREGDQPNGDGRNSDRINVMKYLPEGVFAVVRDKSMLTIGQALNNSMPDMTNLPYTRSYNVIHNYACAVFMDVFKRGFIISTGPDTVPETITVQLASIAAAVETQKGDTVTEYSLSDPTMKHLKMAVTPTGTITPANAEVELPEQHKVVITAADADGNPVNVSALTSVSSLDRIAIDPKTPVGTVLTFTVTSLYVNPSVSPTTPTTPLTATTTVTVVA